MTLRSGNPQALMLPSECLHHYHVDPHPEATETVRPGAGARLGQWLRAFVRREKTAG
ncbi:hypothetical protein PCO31110_04957 [Pandoraea communis]|uniref:Uncharacterized protein n=2 Tax=Burkholderiaceae TaxID=119060 RepID=A0A5E4Z1Z5_9BURK|nr:hypothetical protein PCO31110_04957 [Pandoraea communis]